MDRRAKLKDLKIKKAQAQKQLNIKLKNYTGVIHEDAASELNHSEVHVLIEYIRGLQIEINSLESDQGR